VGFKYSVFTVMTPDLGLDEVPRGLNSIGYDGVKWRVADLPEKIDTVVFGAGTGLR